MDSIPLQLVAEIMNTLVSMNDLLPQYISVVVQWIVCFALNHHLTSNKLNEIAMNFHISVQQQQPLSGIGALTGE